jgi:hypothetical protein
MATSAADLRITVPGTLQETAEGWVLIDIPKALVVLTRREFIAGLKRGKAWKRRQALKVRQAEDH